MARVIKYEIADESTGPLNSATEPDLAINGNNQVLTLNPVIDNNAPQESINGSNGLSIVSDSLLVTKEALDTIIETSLKNDTDQIGKAKLWLTKPLAVIGGGLNFVDEFQIQRAAGESVFTATYVATGETIIENAVTSAAAIGGILDWSAQNSGPFSRFAISAGNQLTFLDFYRENSEQNVRNWFANGASFWEDSFVNVANLFNELGASIPSLSSFALGSDVTVLNDAEYDNFQYIKNPPGSDEITLFTTYNILDATNDTGDDLVIRNSLLLVNTNQHSIIDGGPGQDTISYASAILPAGVEINLNLGFSSSLDLNTGLGNGFPIDVLDNFENAVGTPLSDLLIGNNLANNLTGLEGNDTLIGGEGYDFYLFSDNHGHDFIDDADGDGELSFVNSNSIEGVAEIISDDTWELDGYLIEEVSGELGEEQMRFSRILSGTPEYPVLDPNNSLTINDFSEGETKLGITIPRTSEIQVQVFSPDLQSLLGAPLISLIDDDVEFDEIQNSYTDSSSAGLSLTDLLFPSFSNLFGLFTSDNSSRIVDVNIDLAYDNQGGGSIFFEVDDDEDSSYFANADFNGYVFTDIYDEIPAIENVIINDSLNSLGLEHSDISFTEDTIEVNVSGLRFRPGLTAKLDIQFADINNLDEQLPF
ncbi:hypothetical protein Xen7305DRAFT_00051850 [Xenococcus sp. PCC 7305]|uniref:hypothetical protein n=1 Tax=Xenococcus sp. PCC 7305 TaxID=102125 RepID=UPI0002ACCCF0|nr:hypothetical protein [Xenococcus sp. PCC 7305]ELS05441.1 hypothetical protein Xen7305DRAFT_00051850 [Xenococcus sp. PCC 7305]